MKYCDACSATYKVTKKLVKPQLERFRGDSLASPPKGDAWSLVVLTLRSQLNWTFCVPGMLYGSNSQRYCRWAARGAALHRTLTTCAPERTRVHGSRCPASRLTAMFSPPPGRSKSSPPPPPAASEGENRAKREGSGDQNSLWYCDRSGLMTYEIKALLHNSISLHRARQGDSDERQEDSSNNESFPSADTLFD
ncbi:hypothetical protein EYF80_012500 [Liparis tanakae]|uniref:Uncharacterized protein n=1 Tax=Liparis tanakae TaxID=230148 RepID=A0A4Z2IHN0_9TELE|nr:hypothetical protein EYF80_012500 [Liparis tanakae]